MCYFGISEHNYTHKTTPVFCLFFFNRDMVPFKRVHEQTMGINVKQESGAGVSMYCIFSVNLKMIPPQPQLFG